MIDTFWSPTPIIGIRHWPMAVDGVLSGFHGPWQPGWNEATHFGPGPFVILDDSGNSGPSFSHPVDLSLPPGFSQRDLSSPPHPVPGVTCECGLYAMKPGREGLASGDPFAMGLASLIGPVGGVVELAGRVIEHAHGYRAERARILHLLAFRDLVRLHGAAIAALYQVPVDVFAPWGNRWSQLRRLAARYQRRTV